MQTRLVAEDGSALLPNLDAFNFAKTYISAALASGSSMELFAMVTELRMFWWVKLHVELVVAYTLTRGVRLGQEGLEKLPQAPQPADDSKAVTCAVHHAWHLATALECGLWRSLGKASVAQTTNEMVALRAFFARQYEPKLNALCSRVHQLNVEVIAAVGLTRAAGLTDWSTVEVGVIAAAGLTERLHAAALHSIPIDHAKLMSALINEARRTSKPRPESAPPVTAPPAVPPAPPPGKPPGQPELMVVELDDSEDEAPSPAAAGASVASTSAMEVRRMPGVPDEASAHRLALALLKHRRPCIDYLLSMHQRGSRYQVGFTTLLVRLTLEDLASTLSFVCELSVDQTVHCLGLAALNQWRAYELKIRQAHEAKAEKAKQAEATRCAREKAAKTASEKAAKMALEAAKMASEAAKMASEAAEERLWTGSPDSVGGQLLRESTGLVCGPPHDCL